MVSEPFFMNYMYLFTLLLWLLVWTGQDRGQYGALAFVAVAVIELIDFALYPACV